MENRCRLHPWEELLEQRDDGREVKMGRSDRSRRKSLRNGERERKNEEKRDTDLERPRERNRKRGKGREWRELRGEMQKLFSCREKGAETSTYREKTNSISCSRT